MRAHEFHEEVRRAGIAQEQRAQSAASSRRTSRANSPVRLPVASNSALAPVRASPAVSSNAFAIPPGSVRPRLVPGYRHWTHHEVHTPLATPKDSTASSSGAASEVNTAASSPAMRYDSCSTSPPSPPKKPSPPRNRRNDDSEGTLQGDQQQQDESLEWVGFGRFRHVSTADPEWIKAKLEDELYAPGSYNFFGPESRLGRHPLEEQYERRISVGTNDAEDAASTPSGSLSPTPESVRVRLAQKLRTESSVTVAPDGCIVQKGFEVSPYSSNTASRSSTSINDEASGGGRPNHNGPSRRVTWDERTVSRVDKHNLASIEEQEVKSSKQPERSQSDEGPRNTAHGSRPTQRTKSPSPPAGPKVRIVPAEEADNAIDSDDGDHGTPEKPASTQIRTPLKPSKRLSAPQRGILKKQRNLSADSRPPARPAAVGSVSRSG